MNPEFDYRHGGNKGFGLFVPVKHKIFVSYHHGNDKWFYEQFSNAFDDTYDVIYDNSVAREIDSDDPLYVMQRIRNDYITGSSCTIVLVGSQTSRRKYVDWEIKSTLDAEHGLIGVQLPTATLLPNSRVAVPARLNDNINSGFALWLSWAEITESAAKLQNYVGLAKSFGKQYIDNSRQRMVNNLPNL